MFSFLVACAPTTPVEIATLTFTPSHTLVPSQTPIPSETPNITSTVTPTFTPTLTSTPQPPLAVHEWRPDTVLISVRDSLGDGGVTVGDLGPPKFILYADGSLFITRTDRVDGDFQRRILAKQLNREKICQHLNTLDQIGYLDYDSSTYTFIGGEPNSIGGPSIKIDVNAWISKSDWFYDLEYYLQNNVVQEIYGQDGYPIVSPALRDAHKFLYEYPIDDFEIYAPDRLGVWISPVGKVFFDSYGLYAKYGENNNISIISLLNDAEFLRDNEYQKFVILNGRDAQSLYDYFGNVIGIDYFYIEDPKEEDGKKYYEVFVRPLLPYEMPSGSYLSTIPVPDLPKPNFKLTCYPSDGVLPIPSPSG